MIQWFKCGDKNTKYFHRMDTMHKRFNVIDVLQVEGSTITDPEDIKSHIQDFYLKLCKETKSWRPDFILQDAPVICREEQDKMQGNLRKKKS